MTDSERRALVFLTSKHDGMVLHWIPEHLGAMAKDLVALLEQVRDEERTARDKQWRDTMYALHETDGTLETGGFCLTLSVVMGARSESKETPA